MSEQVKQVHQGEVRKIPLSEIAGTDFGRALDVDAVEELAESLEHNGLLHPITVRSSGDAYELVAGGHRLAAAEKLGWTEIPAVILHIDDDHAELLSLEENLRRTQLETAEFHRYIARALELYVKVHGAASQKGRPRKGTPRPDFDGEMAAKLGTSRKTMKKTRGRLARLVPEALESLNTEELSVDRADELAKLDPDAQKEMLDAAKKMSRDELRKAIKGRRSSSASPKVAKVAERATEESSREESIPENPAPEQADTKATPAKPKDLEEAIRGATDAARAFKTALAKGMVFVTKPALKGLLKDRKKERELLREVALDLEAFRRALGDQSALVGHGANIVEISPPPDQRK